MGDKKHGKKHFGVKQLKPKHFQKALNTTGKVLDVGGKTLMMAGSATGQGELVGLGAGAIEASQGVKKVSKILKKARKKNNKKK